MRSITRSEARQFILSRQGLLGAYQFAGKEGALQYVRQAGCIQFDPVDVCGKNAELTLQSRVKGFQKGMLRDLLYRDRLLVDYTDKELAIWAREDWPYFAGYREMSRRHGQSFAGIPELAAQAIAYIDAHGPVSSDSLPIAGKIHWYSALHWSGNWHGQSQAARSVLEQLYTEGVLLIHHKAGTRKYYDLAAKYLPQELLSAANPCPEPADFLRWRVLRRIGAIGFLWNRRSDAWLGINIDTAQRESAFENLEKEGKILPVQVEGIKSLLYMKAEDQPLLEAVQEGAIDLRERLEFLAPLDPMLWDRRLVEALWDYRYTWEIYTPVEKRKYGYYVLPMLCGQRLIGRIEAAADRKSGTLQVKNLWYEPGVRRTKKLAAMLERSVRRLAAFNDCSAVQFMSEGE